MKNKTTIMTAFLLTFISAVLSFSFLDYEASGHDTEMHYSEYLLEILRETYEFLRKAAPLVGLIIGYLLICALVLVSVLIFARFVKNVYESRDRKTDVLLKSFFRLFTGFRESDDVERTPLQPGVSELNKLIEYSHKRKEIEEEISRLTDALVKSDVVEFADVNRLVISGQNQDWTNGSIDYQRFFKQFGINPDELKVKKDFALFLTPFTPKGTDVFFACQRTLNKLGIILQMTDNKVDKDDILMNIVTKILEASFLIVNIDGRNPNVYYELGIAHALGKPTILISNAQKPEEVHGIDIRQKNMIVYQDYRELERDLLYRLNDMRS